MNITLQSSFGSQGVPPLPSVDGDLFPLIVFHDIKLKAKIYISIFQGIVKNISKHVDHQQCL